jgi:hypothetical protein
MVSGSERKNEFMNKKHTFEANAGEVTGLIPVNVRFDDFRGTTNVIGQSIPVFSCACPLDSARHHR